MNLNQFEYLLAIHEYGSVKMAAQQLFVSAPAISKMIHSLEDELGYTLLTRLPNKVEFTEKGEEAVQVIKRIQDNISQLKRIGEVGFELHGEFMIGSTTHFTCSTIIPIFVQLHNEYSGLKLHLQSGDTDTIIKLTGQDKVDSGLVLICELDGPILLREIKRNKLEFDELFKDELRFVVRQDHPLVKKRGALLMDALKYPYVCYEETVNQSFLDFFKLLFSDQDLGESIDHYNYETNIIRINDRESLFELLSLTDGVTLLPKSNEDFLSERYPNLRFLPISDDRLKCKIGLIYKDSFRSKDKELLIAELKERIFENEGINISNPFS